MLWEDIALGDNWCGSKETVINASTVYGDTLHAELEKQAAGKENFNVDLRIGIFFKKTRQVIEKRRT